MDEGREVIVCYETATLTWKGFKSQMMIWTKFTDGSNDQRTPKPTMIAMNLISLIRNDLKIPTEES